MIRTKETVERHEEEEEESDVVDLLAGPLEDLVQPRLQLSLRIQFLHIYIVQAILGILIRRCDAMLQMLLSMTEPVSTIEK